MKQNYILFLLALMASYISHGQIIFDQPSTGSNGIVSDNFTTDGNAVYATDDFNLTESYTIDVITAFGFQNNGDLETTISGLDVFIYSDAAGVPSSDPTALGTGLLEIVNLDPASPALNIILDGAGGYAFEIDIAAASGSSLTLDAGTYWLIVAPYVTDLDGDVRWNWYKATDGTLSESQLIDPSDVFSAGATSWTPLTSLGLTFSSLAFTIEGATLSVDEFSLSEVSVSPNPSKDFVNIELNPSNIVEKVELYSVTGQLVYEGLNETTIDISNLNVGMYMLNITTQNGSATKRIIKI